MRRNMLSSLVNTEPVRGEEPKMAVKELSLDKNIGTYNKQNITKRWKQEWIKVRPGYRMCSLKMQEYPFGCYSCIVGGRKRKLSFECEKTKWKRLVGA